MFTKPSLITRVAVAKLVGTAVGLFAFFLTPVLWPDADMMLRFGIFFWYILMGAMIGLTGAITEVPLLKIKMPWWFMGPYIGSFMNFVIVLFCYDRFRDLTMASFNVDGIAANPFWFVLEGTVFGFVCAFAAKVAGGEGPETVEGMKPAV